MKKADCITTVRGTMPAGWRDGRRLIRKKANMVACHRIIIAFNNPVMHSDPNGADPPGGGDWMKKKGGMVAADHANRAATIRKDQVPDGRLNPPAPNFPSLNLAPVKGDTTGDKLSLTVVKTPLPKPNLVPVRGSATDDATRQSHDRDVTNKQTADYIKTHPAPAQLPFPNTTVSALGDANMTNEEKQAHEEYRIQKLHDAGYKENGEPGPVLKLMQNKHFQGFANNIAIPMINMYGASSVVKDAGTLLFLNSAKSGGTIAIVENADVALTRTGGTTGHGYAASVTEGGTGQAFAGHGVIRYGNGTTVVPEGTSITMWTGEGYTIPDKMGKLIEMGKYEEILANPDYLKFMEQGAVTHLPGANIPNLTLKAPNRLNIMQASHTVEDATNLNILLKPNMGRMDWASCLEFSPR